MKFSLREIAERLGAEFRGDPERTLTGVASLEEAGPGDLSFCNAGSRWEKKLRSTGAGAVIVAGEAEPADLDIIIAANPLVAFTEAVAMFHPEDSGFDGIHPTAVIAESARVSEPASMGPHVSVGAGSRIGARTRLAAGCRLGAGVEVGEDCRLHANVVLEDGVRLGDRVTIHAGTVVGSDGFGYVRHGGRHKKIPQVGSVRIGDDVEIGAGVCIDRGTLGDTVIGSGVRIDNLVQIAHNVRVGDRAVIVAQVGISGSCDIGADVVLAGKVGLKDHVNIGAGAVVAAAATVTRDIEPGVTVAGYPAGDIETWRKSRVILRNLPRIWPKLLKLLKRAEDDE